MNRNRRNALIAGSLLLLAANLAALGGVAWNRSGEAESKLVLSQRELQRNWSYGFWSEENSGVELRLELRSPSSEPPSDLAPPLPPEQMRALGFSIPDALDEESVRRYRRQQEKQVLLVPGARRPGLSPRSTPGRGAPGRGQRPQQGPAQGRNAVQPDGSRSPPTEA
ncbi:DUF4824 family protein [Pseudomonas aeruginosa]|nr:DUF4824 family protein [Pseudomonas aeruginosa]